MTKQSLSLAKFTRPTVDGMLFRERLFQRLDGPGRHPVVWISGPAGSGKTTLVSSYLEARGLDHLWYQVDGGDADLATFFYYLGLAVQKVPSHWRKPMPLLTPEYLLGIPEFSRNFFAELFERLQGPAVMVFDNAQEVLGETPLYGAIIEGLARIPDDIRIVVVSRSEPPPQFARLRASRMMKQLGWHDLRLSLEEFTAIAARQRGFAKERSATFSRLYEQVDGWAAGLKLVLEGTVNLSDKVVMAVEGEPEEIFDYFAAEVFERVEKDVQECLLKMAFLPRIQVPLAVQLTKNERAGRILNYLHRRNLFLVKLAKPQTTYEYHPLFREFLLTMAEARFSLTDFVHIKNDAALLLEADGQIEEAMTLFQLNDDLPNLIRLFLGQAPVLLAQGRHQTMERLLNAIPEKVLTKTPWLLFWLGAARMPSDPAAARPLFVQAFDLFEENGDVAGVFLAWSGAVDSIVYTFDSFRPFDEWIQRFDQLVDRYPTFPSPEIEVRVITSLLHILALRQPFHPDFGIWEKRVLSAVSAASDITLKVNIHLPLLMAAIFGGDLGKAEKLLWGLIDDIRSTDLSSLAMITLKNFEAFYSWMAGSFEECEDAVTEALELSRSSGIKPLAFVIMCHGASGMLSIGNVTGAKQYFDKLSVFLNRQGRCEQGLYHILKAWQALLDHKARSALLHAEKSLQLLLEMGMPQAIAHAYLAIGFGLHEVGKHEAAADHFSKAREYSIKTNIRQAEFACRLAEANLAYDCGDDEQGARSLTTALSLGRKHGYTNCYFWQPEMMARLCRKALEAGIEKPYVLELIRQRKLVPDKPPLEVEEWPWPLRIYTLGRFELVRDGKSVHFKGKAQQKPLALLKALIALGGRKVGESTLAEALWPDADGDMQHQALATTLHRLRRLLGEKEAIEYRDGQLSFNANYCWVDAWAFERLLSKAETESQKNKEDSRRHVAHYAEKAIDLYKGPFLPQNNEEHWTIYMRERLMSRFLRGVVFLGRTLEQIGEREKAVTRYLQALEVDLKVEEFYQRLMVCYSRLGRHADAVAVYKRCQINLNSMLKVEPSSQTKTIYRNLVAKSVSQASN